MSVISNMRRPADLLLVLVVLCAAGATGGTGVFAASPITDLGTLGLESRAHGINDDGAVVGYFCVGRVPARSGGSVLTTHAFIYRDPGPMKDLGTLGGDTSIAYKINNRGDVVGGSRTAEGASRGFLCTSARGMIALGTLGGTFSHAEAINNRGEMTGTSTAQNRRSGQLAFRYSGGQMENLGTLGGVWGFGLDINDAGVVVGRSTSATAQHAFRYRGAGPMEDLGSLGGTTSEANAINNHGVIVGRSDLADDRFSHAFSYSGSGPMKDLGTLGGPHSAALQINDDGIIVGSAQIPYARAEHAVLWLADGTIVDLEDWLDKTDPAAGARWMLQQAMDVNSSGMVVGWGMIVENGKDIQRAFRLDASSIIKKAGARQVQEFHWPRRGS
jgi:probable HAF family extracellular repeat protein